MKRKIKTVLVLISAISMAFLPCMTATPKADSSLTVLYNQEHLELPEDALTRRRIGFYERHGLVFNSYPYLQPPMRKGQGVLPLRLMTKPAAIDAKTYQRYKKRIHSIVYKYEGDL